MRDIDATGFAAEWIAAWNSHDLDRILAHYDPDITFFSPLAERRTGHGQVHGVDALRAYWAGGIAAQPDLKFELKSVLQGFSALTLIYNNQRGQAVAETVEFGANGKVVRSYACYS